MQPISIAIRGKGFLGMVKRLGEIQTRYGITPAKISQSIDHFASILNLHGCGGTFAVPGIVLERNHLPLSPASYQPHNIEFALHGYRHVDHTRLTVQAQTHDFQQGISIFDRYGLTCAGFRSPYLRWNKNTLTALRDSGFLYDSSQGIAWDVVNGINNDAYQKALHFYGALSATDYPSLPRLENGLVRIPYSLPDDEALFDRFKLQKSETSSEYWLKILDQTYRLGEIFVLGLHPERIYLCEAALTETLRSASSRSPGVWIARLEEVAAWWKARSGIKIGISFQESENYQLELVGPPGVSVLARGVEITTPAKDWDEVHVQASGDLIRFRAQSRPFIAVSPRTAPELTEFLTQQGYIVEETTEPLGYTYYLDRPQFSPEDERPLLAEIETADFPLVRVNRWPNGYRSALTVSGDIEGYTIWDYSMRFFERHPNGVGG